MHGNQHRQESRKFLSGYLPFPNLGYPRFVFDNRVRTLKGEVPVFTFHSVESDRFEAQLNYLKRNGYLTISADEFLAILNRESPAPERAVVLAFDDGWESLRSVAFPLLKRYGFKAVAFVIPGMVEEKARDAGHRRLCTWDELRVMQESGVIDVQSHSLNHIRVFSSSKIAGFLGPATEDVPSKLKMPVYREADLDRWDRPGRLGMPLYESRPLLQGPLRYLDDETLRQLCVRHVAERGGPEFFSRNNSMRELFKLARDYQSRHGERGRYQAEEERDQEMIRELEGAKRMIEEKLPGHRVRHFCYPWWDGCDRAVELSKKVGYETNFWGKSAYRSTNRPGDDPLRIVRLRDYYIYRLPGDGRRSLLSFLGDRPGKKHSWTT